MRINLYCESPDAGPGGAEQFIAVLAEALSAAHEVRIVHHKPPEGETNWQQFSGSDLSRVKFSYQPMHPDESPHLSHLRERYRAAREWRRELSEDCDFFIALLHNRPPFCRATRGVLVVLFPTYEPFAELDKTTGWLRRLYLKWEWRRRLRTYPIKLAISEFSRTWARRRWKIETSLLHPPVAVSAAKNLPKENRILSVGRFATTGHTKKQLELLGTFSEMRSELRGWSYSTVGGLNETEHDEIYFERATKFRDGSRIEVEANVARSRVEELYARSKIFWHAAGFGDDHEAEPEMAEHFGLSTVEAMAQSVVPVTINKGGQSEIVQHGVNGFLWDSLGELREYTRQLAGDPELWQKMSVAAQKRAQDFSRENCVRNLLAAIDRK